MGLLHRPRAPLGQLSTLLTMSTLRVPPPFPLTVDMLLSMVKGGSLSPLAEVRFRTKEGLIIPADANSMSTNMVDGVAWIELCEYDHASLTEALALGATTSPL